MQKQQGLVGQIQAVSEGSWISQSCLCSQLSSCPCPLKNPTDSALNSRCHQHGPSGPPSVVFLSQTHSGAWILIHHYKLQGQGDTCHSLCRAIACVARCKREGLWIQWGGQGSGTEGIRATCLHISDSLFFFLPHVFQRYSPPPRINSITMTAPRMPRSRAALVSACRPVSLTQREWRMLRQERTWDIHCQGEIEREQVDRSKGPGSASSEAEEGGAWQVHSINQVLSSCLVPGILRWTRHGHLEGRTEKIPRSASQRDCSAIEVYILYTGLWGGPLRKSNAQRDFRKE